MDVELTWDHPTTRSDGSAMALADIKGTRIEISIDGGQNYGLLRLVPPAATDYVQTELDPGQYFFRAITVDQFDQESAPAVGSITLLPAAPNGPQNLALTRI